MDQGGVHFREKPHKASQTEILFFFFFIAFLCCFNLTLSSPFSLFLPHLPLAPSISPPSSLSLSLSLSIYLSPSLSLSFSVSVFRSVPGPGGWWFPLSRWPTLIIYWWQENRGRPSQLLLPGTPLGVPKHTHTHTHTQTNTDTHIRTMARTHARPRRGSRLTPCRACRQKEKKKSPSSSFPFLRCHTFVHCSLLLSGVILRCTFAPSPSLRPSLPASSSPSFTSCCGVTDSVTQEQTEGETEGGRGRECESLRVVCKTLEFANAATANALQLM